MYLIVVNKFDNWFVYKILYFYSLSNTLDEMNIADRIFKKKSNVKKGTNRLAVSTISFHQYK